MSLVPSQVFLKCVLMFLFSFFKFFNVYLFLRETETECKWIRGRKRGRHRIQSRPQALSCQHRAWCGAQTHEPWDHDLSRNQTLNWLSHPGTPSFHVFSSAFIYLFNVYLFLRETETECKSVRGRERGRHRIRSRLQAPSYQHRAWCGAWTHDPEVKRCMFYQLSQPNASFFPLFICFVS